jgi:uncharacterized protein (DUF433 family)
MSSLEPGKRSGQPCIRGMRITVEDILRWLLAEMTFEDILSDFPELTKNDLVVALETVLKPLAGRKDSSFAATPRLFLDEYMPILAPK